MASWLSTGRIVFLVAAGSLMLAGCSGGLGGLSPIPLIGDSPQVVDTGDSLRITFDDVDDSDRVYTVSSAGTISLPYLNEVVVRGLTLPEVQTKIEEEFQSAGIFSKPEVNVQPAQFRPYYVLGEVNQPGEFEFRQGMTVQAAISAAGGYTYRAKTSQVEITRTIDGVDIIGTANNQTRVSPGDRIRVVERWF